MMMSKRIEIVSHCWAGELPIYANLLRLQISSLIMRSGHECEVTLTVVHAPGDELTTKVLDWAEGALKLRDIVLNRISVPVRLLFQRAAGRNMAALNTAADVVFFTDCDYLFAEKSLDASLSSCLQCPTAITFPKKVIASKSHSHGDATILSVDMSPSMLVDIDPDDFAPTSYGKAIGGIQIVSGERCRSLGYLPDTKWTRPLADTSKGFLPCRCDVRFRKSVGEKNEAEIDGVYRVRHSQRGRDC
jgi:hypothetical protein